MYWCASPDPIAAPTPAPADRRTQTPWLPHQFRRHRPTTTGSNSRAAESWLWIALGLVVAIVAIVAGRFAFGSDNKSANEVAGATLVVVTQEGYAAEQALIDFVAREVAPKYGIKVQFRGLADSNTINRAVSAGEVAATTYEHRLWLKQVLEANPDFRLTAATPIFRWAFGIWSSKYKTPHEIPNGSPSRAQCGSVQRVAGAVVSGSGGLDHIASGLG